MKSFTDTKGRVWELAVNVGAIKRVRALCGVDLTKIVEVDEQNNLSADLINRLASDPVLLVDVLYAVCKPECGKRGVTDEEFGGSMAGDAIEIATSALLDEIVDFFPEAKRLALKKALTAARRFAEVAKRKLATALNGETWEAEIESKLEQLTGLFSSAPEFAE